MTTFYAGIVTLFGAVAIFLITVWLIAGARPAEMADGVVTRLYRIRGRYFLALIVVLVAALLLTLSRLPYKSTVAAEVDYIVPVTGRIWSWEIGPLEDRDGNSLPSEPLVLPVGTSLEFQVTAMDVNHGFGIYDDSGRLLAQTQAMPGYTNSLVHTFTAPGTYHVLCMEFCGLAHHTMVTTITVE